MHYGAASLRKASSASESKRPRSGTSDRGRFSLLRRCDPQGARYIFSFSFANGTVYFFFERTSQASSYTVRR